MKKIQSESIDLIFADPPYWMQTKGILNRTDGTKFSGCNDEWDKFQSIDDYKYFTKEWLNECYRILKPNGSIWVIGSMQCIYSIGNIMQDIGYWFINDVIWHKKNPTPNFRGSRLNNSHETLIWATKNKSSKYTFNYHTAKELNIDNVNEDEYIKGNRKQMGSIWRFSVCSGNERLKDENGNKVHNTQKPQELLERIILISSKVGDTVLDPFGGTMTTARAAKKLGRNYIMIEKDARYCKYGEESLKNICFADNDITKAKLDDKPIRVTLSEMIEDGYLIDGENLYLKGNNEIASLQKDGKVTYQDKLLDIHHCAALASNSKAERLNGFDYWYVKRNNELISINKIRDEYRKKKVINE